MNGQLTIPQLIYLMLHPRRSDTNSITFKVRHVKPGEYLLRLHVDGAESQLSIDTNSDSPTFNWYIAPRVLIGS